jgi:hypothetical protein
MLVVQVFSCTDVFKYEQKGKERAVSMLLVQVFSCTDAFTYEQKRLVTGVD